MVTRSCIILGNSPVSRIGIDYIFDLSDYSPSVAFSPAKHKTKLRDFSHVSNIRRCSCIFKWLLIGISQRTLQSWKGTKEPPQGQPVGEIAKETGLSDATLYEWKKQPKAKGLVAPDEMEA